MINLFFKFIYTGLLAFGGGLATIPILYSLLVEKGILTDQTFYNMVAISQATPGPIGLNLATYVGFLEKGILGSVVASIGITMPSIIFVSIFARIYGKIKDNKIFCGMMKSIKAGIIGVILVAVINILKVTLINQLNVEGMIFLDKIISIFKEIDYLALSVIMFFLLMMKKINISPVWYILIGGVIGIFI